MQRIILIILMAALTPSISFAKQKNVYTQCGIGALIFQKTGWAAAISNIIWDLGTTGSTSSSSSPDQCAGKGSSVGKLIYENYANVEEETAAGRGKHLTAMLSILDCDASVHPAIISDVRSDFMKSVNDSSYTEQTQLEKTEKLFNNVMDKVNHKYAGHCAAS